ncbi:Eukaryotic translation initiation factor 3 subunit CLU1 TIF31 protein [Rutstroemia sp. NJR-2017a BVV2]|nr:Eukaryotic translation initiation factor 3 subunit CLU1 TIF31 protein [Rutstroemia sp. NJR-2017a BVV2]
MSASAPESNVAAGSFTPVRRKNFTLSDGRLRREVEKEWTATRCNRLLRRLTSKIAILRKERARSLAKSQSNKRMSRTSLNVDESEKESSRESNWIGSRKKVKRTYSGRSGSIGYGSDHENNGRQLKTTTYSRMSSFPGEIIVPTPLLNRALKKSTISSQAIPFQVRSGDKTSKTYVSEESFGIRPANRASKTFSMGPQVLRDVRKTTSSMHCNAYEGIYDHFKNLLEATQTTPHDLPRTGTKSLLSTCLRAIPKYISLEERTMAEEVEEEGPNSALEKRDVSMEVYDDLETFGSLGHGWTQLQNVVRAHGVHIICNAIADGLLDDQFSEQLVELCVQSGNEDEGQSLLSSILSRCKFPAPRKVDDSFLAHCSLRPLSLLWRFTEHTGRSGYHYRQLSTLIDSQRLPISWLAAKAFEHVWTGIIQSLSTDETKADAAQFMSASLPRLVEFVSLEGSNAVTALGNDIHAACRHTLLSVLTTTTSIAILCQDENSDVSEQPSSQIHYKLLRDCFTMIITTQKDSKDQSTIFLLANLVVGPSTDQLPSLSVELVDRNLHSMWEQHKSSANTVASNYNEVINFLSSMARCCGRAASNSGFEYLQRIHKAMRHWVTSRQSKETSIWYEIMVDSAFTFAQQAPGEKFLNYAVSLDGELKARILDRPTSSSLQDCAGSPGAFRWEEGISAWVTRTPAQAQVGRKNTRAAIDSEPGVLESPSPSVMARTQRPVRASLDGLINNRSRSRNSCLDQRIASKHTTRIGKRKAITPIEIWHSDSSDDELNSSFESSQENHVLKNVPNMTQRKRCRLNRATHHKLHREAKTDDHNAKSFSEDELCI